MPDTPTSGMDGGAIALAALDKGKAKPAEPATGRGE